MSVLFPLGLDDFSNPPSGDLLNDPDFFHDVQHVHANDALWELMSKVGPNASTDINSLDYQMETHVHDPDRVDDGGPINHADLGAGTHPPLFAGARGSGTESGVADEVILWQTEDYDTHSYHDNSVNPSRFTVPAGKSGFYLLVAWFDYSSVQSAGRGMQFQRNGTAIGEMFDQTSGTGTEGQTCMTVSEGVEGDYFEMFANTGAGNFALDAPSYMAVIFLGHRVTEARSVSRSQSRSNTVGVVV